MGVVHHTWPNLSACDLSGSLARTALGAKAVISAMPGDLASRTEPHEARDFPLQVAPEGPPSGEEVCEEVSEPGQGEGQVTEPDTAEAHP